MMSCRLNESMTGQAWAFTALKMRWRRELALLFSGCVVDVDPVTVPGHGEVPVVFKFVAVVEEHFRGAGHQGWRRFRVFACLES